MSLAFSVSGPDSRCVVTCHGHVTGWPTLLTLSGRAQSCRFPTSAGPDSCAAFFSSTASVSCAGCLVLVVFPALIFSLELQNFWPSSQPDDWHMALCFHVCFLTVAWPCLCLCFPTGIHIPSLLAKCPSGTSLPCSFGLALSSLFQSWLHHPCSQWSLVSMLFLSTQTLPTFSSALEVLKHGSSYLNLNQENRVEVTLPVS